MPKKLVYLFGPDGAGKSTLGRGIASCVPNSLTLHGSNPASWPDTSWHREAVLAGIDPATKDPRYHLETLGRCYAMIGGLLRAENPPPLIIDSDPRAQIAVKACTLYGHPVPLPDFHTQLDALALPHIEEVEQVGVHVTVGRGTPEERAETLARRIANRGDASPFDPASLDQARDLVLAFDALEILIAGRGAPLVRIETDRPIDHAMLSAQILEQ